MAKAKKAKAAKSKAKKSKAKKTKKKPAKRAAAAASRGARKTKAKKPKKAARKAKAKRRAAAKAKKSPAKKAAAPKKKKQIVGEGDYQASRKFFKDEANFVKRNSSEIPQMGKDAEAALDGPQGGELRAAEAKARGHSKTGPEM